MNAPQPSTPASDFTQRWRDGRHSWRHTSEGGFDKTRFDVAPLDELAAKRFVETHHYSRAYPAAMHRAGLYEADRLVGVAVLGVPARREVLTRPFPGLQPYRESAELSRFVLLDVVPANAESWFLAQVFRLAAQQGVRGVVAFADPVPRIRADGTVLSPGHVGTIYQASNGVHTDRGSARTLLLGPDGRILSARTIQKIRAQESGHDYAERQLVEWGAAPLDPGEDPADWLREAIAAAGIRRMRHPGHHRYLFRIGRTRGERSRVAIGMTAAPYPKKDAA